MRRLAGAWRTSGLTKKAFADDHGIKYAALLWWFGELKRRDAERAPRRRTPAAEGQAALAQLPGLVPVQIVEAVAVRGREASGVGARKSEETRTSFSASEVEQRRGIIELVPFGQVRIRVPPDFDPQALRLLLNALDAPC